MSSKKPWLTICVFLFFLGLGQAFGDPVRSRGKLPTIEVPILLYHRFAPTANGAMTTPTYLFESHLTCFREFGFTVIPLRCLIDFYLGKGPELPSRSVVLTADDGHRSVYEGMFPLLKRYRVPATLFLYPSAISNASYALTWNEVREMKETGLVDVQSHTFWHPNFKEEKKRLTHFEYDDFVLRQLVTSKENLEKELHAQADMLAWPFGIYDDQLIRKAVDAGYVAAFTMVRHHSTPTDPVMALPRYLITNSDREGIRRILEKGYR